MAATRAALEGEGGLVGHVGCGPVGGDGILSHKGSSASFIASKERGSKLTGGVTLGTIEAADAPVVAIEASFSAAEGAAYVSVAPAADDDDDDGAWVAADEADGLALASSAVGKATPRGPQTALAKASVACWSAGEQSEAMEAPTASMNEADLQMQVKSVRVQEVEAMPLVADFWAHSGSLERSGREAWSWARTGEEAKERRVRRVRVVAAADVENEGSILVSDCVTKRVWAI